MADITQRLDSIRDLATDAQSFARRAGFLMEAADAALDVGPVDGLDRNRLLDALDRAIVFIEMSQQATAAANEAAQKIELLCCRPKQEAAHG
jgi:hypothetical protein